jgi:decaprenyl-phosphate phosphoribosyltransferase
LPTHARETMETLHKIFYLVRPSQQLKTGAVVLGALASGKVESVDSVLRLSILTILWIGLATAVYIINDLTDLDLDRLHPKKSKRPIASGLVSAKFASATLIALLLVNAIVFPLLDLNVAICALIYLLLNIAYSAKLKNFVVIDILIVCAGFVLRGLSGVLIVDATPSLWFVLLSLFGSLLLVSGKRFAQITESTSQGSPRNSITMYSPSFLKQLQTISSTGLIISYVMMTQEKPTIGGGAGIILEISIIPFLATILYINYYQDSKSEEEVTQLLVSRRPVLYSGLIWLLLFAASLMTWEA